MVEELDLTDQDASAITKMSDMTYIPDWAARELSSNIRNEAVMSDYCSTEGQIDSSPVINLSSFPASIVLERLPSGRKYWSNSPRAGNESYPVNQEPTCYGIRKKLLQIAIMKKIYDQWSTVGTWIIQVQIQLKRKGLQLVFRVLLILFR